MKVLRVAVSSESGELQGGGKESEMTDMTQCAYRCADKLLCVWRWGGGGGGSEM